MFRDFDCFVWWFRETDQTWVARGLLSTEEADLVSSSMGVANIKFQIHVYRNGRWFRV